MSIQGNKLALVTGAAQGIGLTISERLVDVGYSVAMLDINPSVMESAKLLASKGANAKGHVLDLSNLNSISSLQALIGQSFKDLSVLVNNAGISPKHQGKKRQFIDIPLAEWQRVIDINLTANFLITQICLSPMMNNQHGRVINITSQAARTRTPVPGAHYAASKAGIAGYTRILAGEVAQYGITVNCIAPGRIESKMTAEVGDSVNAELAKSIPIGRLGKPQDVAAVVEVLVSDSASYLTGVTIDVNGGNFMA
jgi:3-oxoacyl-[acyl-carrier protein] reductase